MNCPHSLPTETAAWLQTQIVLSVARAVAPLQDEINKLEDYACGIYGVLHNLMPPLLKANPSLASELLPYWQGAAARHEQLENGTRVPEIGESVEILEARKDLFSHLDKLGVWRGAGNTSRQHPNSQWPRYKS